MWANATSWESPIDAPSFSSLISEETRGLDGDIADDLNKMIALRDGMTNEKMVLDSQYDDFTKMPVKDLLMRYKDLKRVISNLLHDITNAEEKEKSIKDDLNIVCKILLNGFGLNDSDTMQLVDKANVKAKEIIEALQISHKRDLYLKHRKTVARIQELIYEAHTDKEEKIEHKCSICLDNPPSYVIAPCGHVMCNCCKSLRSKATSCHICRGSIRDVFKFYL